MGMDTAANVDAAGSKLEYSSETCWADQRSAPPKPRYTESIRL